MFLKNRKIEKTPERPHESCPSGPAAPSASSALEQINHQSGPSTLLGSQGQSSPRPRRVQSAVGPFDPIYRRLERAATCDVPIRPTFWSSGPAPSPPPPPPPAQREGGASQSAAARLASSFAADPWRRVRNFAAERRARS